VATASVWAGQGPWPASTLATTSRSPWATLSLSGTDASNYALASGVLDITPKLLPVTGMSVQNKVYDGTVNASFTGTPTVGGALVSGDDAH
jgi:hypothetical protein